jgi:hypothetical protein
MAWRSYAKIKDSSLWQTFRGFGKYAYCGVAHDKKPSSYRSQLRRISGTSTPGHLLLVHSFPSFLRKMSEEIQLLKRRV